MTTNPVAKMLYDAVDWAKVDRLVECDFCPTLFDPPSPDRTLCDLCQMAEDKEARILERDAVAHAILYGDESDVLQAFGDPGDGDLADYL